MMYKLYIFNGSYTVQNISNGSFLSIDSDEFIQDIKEHGTSIVEGADVIEPDYVALRTGPDGYAPIADQLDMQFKNDGSWEAHVQAVKDKYPKTITGGTTIAPLPQWVLDLVE